MSENTKNRLYLMMTITNRVMGWNQCVKCVAPRSSAQVFIASAISLAAESGSGWRLFRH